MILTQQISLKKVLIISFFVVIGLFFIVSTIGFWSIKPILSKRLKTAVLESTDSLYHLDFKDIKYNLIAGNAEVLGVVWRADSSLYNSLKIAKKLPDNIYQGKVNRIRLSGLHPWTIFFSKKLELSTISITDPNVELLHEKQQYNSFKTAKSPYQIISKFIKSFSVNKIVFQNINLTYHNQAKPNKRQISKIENLDLEISDLLIDSTSEKDKKRFYYTKECVFSLKKVQIPSKDSLNTVKINELVFSTKTRSLSVKHMVVQPRFKEMEYSVHTNGDDRIGIIFNDIELKEIDIEKLFKDKKIYAEVLNINRGNVTVFTDTRTFNVPPKAPYRPFPHEAFRDWNVKFMIDTVKMKNFNITYSEYNPETKLVGNVIFKKVTGRIKNFTNDTITLKNDPNCQVVFNGYFMNTAAIILKFDFNMMSPKSEFLFMGNVKKMEMPQLNQVTSSLGFARAEKGTLNEFTCNLKGNKYGLNGSATMLYQDLNITLLKKGDEPGLKKKKLLSFLANEFVIKDGNPMGKQPVRVSPIKYERIPTKPFFYTMWKGILSGITKSVMG
jgi:hypothetical protein